MPKLCKAGQQLREQIDDAFPDRSRVAPEGWLGDQRHAARKSDHNPTAEGIVRAIDINANLQTAEGVRGRCILPIPCNGRTQRPSPHHVVHWQVQGYPDQPRVAD